MQSRLKKILATYLDVKNEMINNDFSAANSKGWCGHLQANQGYLLRYLNNKLSENL